MKLVLPRRPAAFSLIEIVLALGVFSIAIVVIIGLLPVALGTTQQSRSETAIATIGRTILGDLRAYPFDQVKFQTGGTTGNPTFSAPFSLATPGTVYLKFAPDAQNTLRPVGLGSQSAYQGGAPNDTPPKASFVAKIDIVPDPKNTSLSQVIVSIEHPAAAAEANRTAARFATYVCK